MIKKIIKLHEFWFLKDTPSELNTEWRTVSFKHCLLLGIWDKAIFLPMNTKQQIKSLRFIHVYWIFFGNLWDVRFWAMIFEKINNLFCLPILLYFLFHDNFRIGLTFRNRNTHASKWKTVIIVYNVLKHVHMTIFKCSL